MTETNYERPPFAPAPKWPQYKVTKARNQVKSKFYYIFWGAATVSVVLGQLYVGTGYRSFAQAINRVFDTIEIEVGREYNGRRYY